jgi:hypothetical protein
LDDFDAFMAFMRYNNWERDVFSNGDPEQQIMARSDLRGYKNPYGAATPHGGLDSKAGRLSEVTTRLAFHAVASPAHANGIPPWSFDNPAFNLTDHRGLPDNWTFDDQGWQWFTGNGFAACAVFGEKRKCVARPFCGWCGAAGKCMAGGDRGPFVPDETCASGWTAEGKLPDWVIGCIAGSSGVVLIMVVTIVIVVVRRRMRA